MLLTDREEPVFRLVFTDETREPQEIAMAEFIDEKSPKAKGKRLSTLEISRIEDITPEPEPEAEEDGEDADSSEGANSSEAESAKGAKGAEGAASRTHLHEEHSEESEIKQETTISVEDVPMTITTHHTDEEDNQLSLF